MKLKMDKNLKKVLYAITVLAGGCISAISLFVLINSYEVSLMDLYIDTVKNNSTWIVVLTILLSIAYYLIDKKCKGSLWLFVLSLMIAVSWAASYSYLYTASLDLLFASSLQVIKCSVYVIGMTLLLYYGTRLFKYCITIENKNEYDFKIHYLFVGILLVWTPAIIVTYPANIYGDTWNQIAMAFDYLPKTNANPVVPTMLISYFLNATQNLCNSKCIGLFIIELLQICYAAFAFSYMISIMNNRLKAPKWLIIMTLLLISVSPYWTNSVITLVKDIPYSVSVLLITIGIILLLIDGREYFNNVKNLVILFVSILVACLFRNNGKVLVIIVLIPVAYVLKKINAIKKIRYYIMPIILAVTIESAMFSLYGFTKWPVVEMLCMPIQQVARIAIYHPDGITQEEKAIISEVCNYETMISSYAPLIADPVKETYDKYAPSEDYREFLKVWGKLVIRYPVTALSATINQNFPLLFPFLENHDYYIGANTFHDYGDVQRYGPIANDLGIVNTETFAECRDMIVKIYDTLDQVPFLKIFSQQAVYSLAILTLLVITMENGTIGSFTKAALPAIVTFIMIVLGPCIQYMPRYSFPIAYCTPVLIAYCSFLLRKGCKTKTPCL